MLRFAPIAISLVALLLGMEYKGGRRGLLRVLQALAVLVILANVVMWVIDVPAWYPTALGVAALAVNVPLAAMGLKRN